LLLQIVWFFAFAQLISLLCILYCRNFRKK